MEMQRVKDMAQVLEEEGYLAATAKGSSMLPCIRPGRDVLVLEKPECSPKKHDVILYGRKNGTYILHRILEIGEKGYVLCGDNQYKKESGVKESQILGVLKGFYRGEKYIDCEADKKYRCFVKIWCASIRFRKIAVRCGTLWRRIQKKDIV